MKIKKNIYPVMEDGFSQMCDVTARKYDDTSHVSEGGQRLVQLLH
jgi:hypothetical protein